MILTPHGEIPIENIDVGDVIYAYDEGSKRRVETEVAEKLPGLKA